MIILPNSPEMPLSTMENTLATTFPGLEETHRNIPEIDRFFQNPSGYSFEIPASNPDLFHLFEGITDPSGTSSSTFFGCSSFMNDRPPVVINNSYDDEDDEDEIDDVPDEEDDDVYEEVEQFDDFDDEFDEDFEDEFDEDYEDLARIDDEDLEGDDDDAGNTSPRYEEEFDDIDVRTKFIPDGAAIGLNEEVLISEDDIDESDTSDFDDFEDDNSEEDFNEYDN